MQLVQPSFISKRAISERNFIFEWKMFFEPTLEEELLEVELISGPPPIKERPNNVP
jgi:hypothetical protein